MACPTRPALHRGPPHPPLHLQALVGAGGSPGEYVGSAHTLRDGCPPSALFGSASSRHRARVTPALLPRTQCPPPPPPPRPPWAQAISGARSTTHTTPPSRAPTTRSDVSYVRLLGDVVHERRLCKQRRHQRRRRRRPPPALPPPPRAQPPLPHPRTRSPASPSASSRPTLTSPRCLRVWGVMHSATGAAQRDTRSPQTARSPHHARTHPPTHHPPPTTHARSW